MSFKMKDLLGMKFGRWLVVSEVGKGRPLYFKCLCDCGNTKEIRKDSLLTGDSKSCGCLAKELAGKHSTTHGHSNHRLFGVYTSMLKRCLNSKSKDYHHYGGRGIKVCDEWYLGGDKHQGFLNFIRDMEGSYKEGLELERYETGGDYCVDNCGWVSRKSQTNNLRRNSNIEYKGLLLTSSEWGLLLGVNGRLLAERVIKWGNSFEVLTKPFINRAIIVSHEGVNYKSQSLMRSKGYTQGYINGLTTNKTQGCSLKALEYLGIPFEVVVPKYKEVPTPEIAVEAFLNKENKTPYEEELATKIRKIKYEF